jgi:hypothetical protein
MEEIRIKWQRFAEKLVYKLTTIKERDYRPYCKNCNHYYTGIGNECVMTNDICWWV